MTTATHTGRVGLRVELHDGEPPEAGSQWQEVVEVSFLPFGDEVRLVAWGGEGEWQLNITTPGSYRVRYCVTDMGDEGRDSYLMQFWPVTDETPRPDAVLRHTSSQAGYWHGAARREPPPPTPEQVAEAARLAELERRRKQERYRREDELRRWGGRAPSQRLRQVRGNIFGLVRLDRDLIDAVAALSPDRQRAVARWAARHAFTFAGLAELDWVAAALDALDRGDPLPEPFDDQVQVWDRLYPPDKFTRISTLELRPFSAEPTFTRTDIDPAAAALPAIWAAAEPDPLQAALEALWAAATAYGRDTATFLAEARRILLQH